MGLFDGGDVDAAGECDLRHRPVRVPVRHGGAGCGGDHRVRATGIPTRKVPLEEDSAERCCDRYLTLAGLCLWLTQRTFLVELPAHADETRVEVHVAPLESQRLPFPETAVE